MSLIHNLRRKEIGLILASVFTVLLLHAEEADAGAACNPFKTIGTYCNTSSHNDINSALVALMQYILSVLGPVVLIFIVIAGVKYMVSAGSEENIKSSKRMLIGAVTGMAVALLAYTVLKVILDILNTP